MSKFHCNVLFGIPSGVLLLRRIALFLSSVCLVWRRKVRVFGRTVHQNSVQDKWSYCLLGSSCRIDTLETEQNFDKIVKMWQEYVFLIAIECHSFFLFKMRYQDWQWGSTFNTIDCLHLVLDLAFFGMGSQHITLQNWIDNVNEIANILIYWQQDLDWWRKEYNCRWV